MACCDFHIFSVIPIITVKVGKHGLCYYLL